MSKRKSDNWSDAMQEVFELVEVYLAAWFVCNLDSPRFDWLGYRDVPDGEYVCVESHNITPQDRDGGGIPTERSDVGYEIRMHSGEFWSCGLSTCSTLSTWTYIASYSRRTVMFPCLSWSCWRIRMSSDTVIFPPWLLWFFWWLNEYIGGHANKHSPTAIERWLLLYRFCGLMIWPLPF